MPNPIIPITIKAIATPTPSHSWYSKFISFSIKLSIASTSQNLFTIK